MDDDEGRMPPTEWSMVLQHGSDSEVGRACLARLIETYSGPVFRFLRKRGLGREQAEDVTQGFFLELLEKGGLRGADPREGKFRNLICTAVKRFARGEYRRAQTLRRGGDRQRLSLDHAAAELRHLAEDAGVANPELALQREWAAVLKERVIARLRAQCEDERARAVLEALHPYLLDEAEAGDYAPIAERFGISLNNAKVQASRMRKRWRRLALEEAAQTCGSIEEAKAELDDLVRTLRGG